MSLFDDDQNTVATPQPEQEKVVNTEKPKATVKPAAKANKKPMAIGDYAWIAGIVVVVVILVIWLFGGSSSDTAPVKGGGQIQSSGPRPAAQTDNSNQYDGDFREQISGILLQQKEKMDSIESTSKNGMMVLSSQLQSANEQIKNLSTEVQRLKMRLAGNGDSISGSAANNSGQYSQALPLLKGFSINDLSGDLAWVKYNNQTYAVKVGSQLGGVTVTGIDTENRIVTTSKGLIR